MKKFTVKSIRKTEKPAADKEIAKEEIVDIYKETQNLPEIQKPVYHKSIWVLVVLVSMLFGFASSFAYDFLFTIDVGTANSQKIIIEKQEEVTVAADERLRELGKTINPVIVNFYDQTKGVDWQFYQDDYSFGNGFILTTDGWIVTVKSVMNKIGNKKYALLTADYKIYTAEKILSDPTSDVVFVKIKADDLPVVKFGDASDVSSGQEVFGFIASYPESRRASLHIADLQFSALEDVVASSEKHSHFFSSREGYDPSLIGAPLVNLSGEIIAVVVDSNSAMPVAYLETAIDDLSKKEKIYRPYFGVHYLNLAKYPRVDAASGEMRDRGALLSGWQNLTAVVKGSPADKAGLKVGDIITMVEDELVNGKKSLTQIIGDYNTGDKIGLTVLSNGREKVVETELGVMD